MNELKQILDHWRRMGSSLDDFVLASVVHVRGSAYRRPGARMLIGGDGTRIGTVSGGCLETEVVRKAWWWSEGGPSIRVFDNRHEDAARDFGLGCNGEITVLVERARSSSVRRLLCFLDRHQRRREGVVVATTTSAAAGSGRNVGDRVLFGPNGKVYDGATPDDEELALAARATLEERTSRLLRLSDGEIFVEFVAPPQRLFVFGAGHDAVPVCEFAARMGWMVTVASTRSSELRSDRFPAAAALFTVPHSGDISTLGIGSDDAVVLMTHNFAEDARLLPQLLAAAPRYLGMLGPRRRAEKLFVETGCNPHGARVHAPVGLDIGGDDPEAIALSIVAEVQAVLAGAEGGYLHRRRGSIHVPSLEVDCADADAGRARITEPVHCGLVATG